MHPTTKHRTEYRLALIDQRSGDRIDLGTLPARDEAAARRVLQRFQAERVSLAQMAADVQPVTP